MSDILSVWMHINGEQKLAGRLGFDGSQHRFSYADAYMLDPKAISLDPTFLPINIKDHVSNDLIGVFRDAAPDSWGRFIIAKRLNVSDDKISDMDCLINASNDRVGALEFTVFNGHEDVAPVPEEPLSLMMLADGIKAIANGELTDRSVIEVLKFGSSMGGARPKVTIRHDNIDWLVKLNRHNDSINMCRCEHAAMTLAKTLGVNVAETHIETVSDIDILLVKRFDRVDGIKIPFMSALTATGRVEMDFMNSSYVELNNISKQLSDSNHGEQWFRRMLFNVLCNNDDDHLRNHAFLFRKGEWVPTPAYDIMPQAIHTELFRLAIGLSEGDRKSSIPSAIRAGHSMGIDNSEDIAKEMLDGFRDWESHFKNSGVNDEDIKFFARTFNRHK